MIIEKDCDNEKFSSDINEVIRAVLNFFLGKYFACTKSTKSTKITQGKKDTKSTKKHQKHQKAQKSQKHNQAKAQNANK